MGINTEDLYRRLDEVALQEEELFRKRQGLVHRTIQEERSDALKEEYLSIRQQESNLRCEHLRILNAISPGHEYRDHTIVFGPEKTRRKYTYLVLIAVSALGLLFLLARL